MVKKKYLLILLAIALFLPVGITFTKYVTENVKNYIMEANHFYFNSDKLVEGGKDYNINNWSGAGSFAIQFSLNNHQNNLLTSDTDITYDLSITCDTGITCSLTNASGTIYQEEMTDNYELVITAQRVFNDAESVNVTISATSTSPYVKTLSADFTITVGKRGISYEIKDQTNQPYLLFDITNALETYKVLTAFGSYSVNELISTDDYLALSATDKDKCTSAMITLTFDPTEVILDTTSSVTNSSTKGYTTVDGVSYISSITFGIDALSSTELRFYKLDTTEDYTYPFENETSVISFSAV